MCPRKTRSFQSTKLIVPKLKRATISSFSCISFTIIPVPNHLCGAPGHEKGIYWILATTSAGYDDSNFLLSEGRPLNVSRSLTIFIPKGKGPQSLEPKWISEVNSATLSYCWREPISYKPTSFGYTLPHPRTIWF